MDCIFCYVVVAAMLNVRYVTDNKFSPYPCWCDPMFDGKFITIPLDFDGHIITAILCTPSEEELMALRVIWVMPPMETITPQSIRRSRVMLKDYQFQVPGDKKQSV